MSSYTDKGLIMLDKDNNEANNKKFQ